MIATPTDIPVRIADIIPFAKKRCKTCFGAGMIRVNGKDRPCGCGLRRFLEVQRVRRDGTGQLFFVEPVVAWSAAGQAAHEGMQKAAAEAATATAEAGAGDGT